MTEAEWLASEDPAAMLEALKQGEPCAGRTQGQVDRRMRLWVEACRLRWPDIAGSTDLTDQTRLLQACEQWAATYLHAPAGEIAALLRDIVGNPWRPVTLPYFYTGDRYKIHRLAHPAYMVRREDGSLDPDRLKVLADALEEAGCVDEFIINHLRGMQPCFKGGRLVCFNEPEELKHVRGCWVLDLILGKE